MRGSESIKGHPIRCYDNGGKTFDRFTVVYMDEPTSCTNHRFGLYAARGMSENPYHPQGFGQYGEARIGKHLGKRISFKALPKECRQAVLQDITEVSE